MYAAVHVLASGRSFRSQSWNRTAPLTVAAVPAYAPQPRKDKAEGLHGYTITPCHTSLSLSIKPPARTGSEADRPSAAEEGNAENAGVPAEAFAFSLKLCPAP